MLMGYILFFIVCVFLFVLSFMAIKSQAKITKAFGWTFFVMVSVLFIKNTHQFFF